MSIERLKQVMLLEQFYDCVPEELKVYLMNKNYDALTEATHKADEYVTLHKISRTKRENSKLVKNKDNAYDNSKFNYKDKEKNMLQAIIIISILIVEIT